jgi:hypothetical protein
MAIGWAGAFYIQRSRGGSAARTIAYNTRSEIFDERQGELWKGTHKIATLRHAEAMLPDGADEKFRNFGFFANTLEASEKRRDSVVGRDIITPLPRGASLEAQIELARGFFQERFVDHGVPVILTLHRQDDDHAHGFVPGRYLEKDRWSAKKAVVSEPERHNWSAAWREYQERRGISVDAPALIPGKHLGPRHSRNPTSELFKRQAERDRLNKTRSLSQGRGQMELSDGTNTISIVRYQAAKDAARERQSDECETVHNGSGRSEELPSELNARHKRERWQLENDYKTLSVQQWLQHHPDTDRTHFLAEHEKIDDEIIKGLERKAETRSLSQERGQMELSDGSNTISDERFKAAEKKMFARHDAEHETVRNGSGRSEELPHQLLEDRKNLGVQQWLQIYPDTERAMKSQDLAKLSNEQIVAGLWQAAKAPLSEQEQAIRVERGVEANQKDRLYNQYKAEKAYALSARKDAEQKVFSLFAAYQQSLGSFYAIRHEQQKLEVTRGSERRKEHEVLKAEHGRDRVEAQQLRRQQLAAVRQEHQVPTWDSFLRREAQRGDREAEQALLRHERAQERVQEQNQGRGD